MHLAILLGGSIGSSYNALMQAQMRQIGGLRVRTVDRLEGRKPESIVVLMHGFGAPGSDLVPIGGELLDRSDRLAERTRFLFPEAPLDLMAIGMPGARAWWMLDMERFNTALHDHSLLDPASREEPPAGIEEARELVTKMLDEVREETGLPNSKIVLGGFSQGSMLACDLALRQEEAPAAMISSSSMPICVSEWKRLAPRRADLPVFQSHGRQDPLLPYPLAEELRGMLDEAGCRVEYVPFEGMHGISLEVYDRVLPWLEGILGEG